MLYFKAKMHQIRFPPQILLGELTALPRPSNWIQGVLLLRKGEKKKGKKKIERGRQGGRKGKEEGKGQGGYSVPPSWLKP